MNNPYAASPDYNPVGCSPCLNPVDGSWLDALIENHTTSGSWLRLLWANNRSYLNTSALQQFAP